MNANKRPANRALSEWRLLIAILGAVVAFASATPAVALTSVGAGAFSPGSLKVTFEDLPGSDNPLPAGYGSGVGVSFTAGNLDEAYAAYGTTLATAATGAGLGNVAGTWGCNGTCGTGFSIASPQLRVGFYISSNVDLTVQITALRNGLPLGSVTPSFAANQIGFVGLEDAGGSIRSSSATIPNARAAFTNSTTSCSRVGPCPWS